MDFGEVLANFGQDVPVTDTNGAYQNGVWAETSSSSREVFAIVLAMTTEQEQFFTEGDSSSGAITLTTDETLYFADVLEGGVEKRQSYVDYGGYRFKVIGTGFMQQNTLHNIYNCIRYIA